MFLWRTTDPVSSARMYKDKEHGFTNRSRPTKIFNTVYPVVKGDRVGLMCTDGESLLSAPIKFNKYRPVTLRDILKSIEAGMKVPFNPNTCDVESVYTIIASFFSNKERLKLVTLFEQGRLTPYDLARDNYDYFQGGGLWKNGNMWVYAAGS